MYSPGHLPLTDLKELVGLLNVELRRISAALEEQKAHVPLSVRHVAPEKPREGNLYVADGADWDPGYGRGVYWFNGSEFEPVAVMAGLTFFGTLATVPTLVPAAGSAELTWNSEVKGSPYTHTDGSAEVTVDSGGNYLVTVEAEISLSGDVTGDAGSGTLRIQVDSGSGYTTVQERMSARTESGEGDETSASLSALVELTSGDKVRLQVIWASSTGNLSLRIANATIRVERK